jgi:hypothetical protein
MSQTTDQRAVAFEAAVRRVCDADGNVRTIDRDIVERDSRKGEPRSTAEAAERYRLMQAEQLVRIYEQCHGSLTT